VTLFDGDFEVARNGIGSMCSVAIATATAQNAMGYQTVQIGSGSAGMMVTNTGVALGAEANLAVYTMGAGDPTGTTGSVNIGAGIGLYGELKYGQDNQYGFSLPLVVLPVGVSVYVKGGDAVAAWSVVRNWQGTTFDAARHVGQWGIDWSKDVRLSAVNTYDNAALIVYHQATSAYVWTKDISREAVVQLSGTAGNLGPKIGDAVLQITDEMISPTTNAATALASWATTAGSTVVSTYDSAAGWLSPAGSAIGGAACSFLSFIGSSC
jgi:hypothetical protein